MRRTSLTAFVRNHRREIDEHINKARTRHDRPGFVRDPLRLTDDDRRTWILNDEDLYNWARSEGVKV